MKILLFNISNGVIIYITSFVLKWMLFYTSSFPAACLRLKIGLIFNTGPYGEPPLKFRILKIGFPHAREDKKIGQETNFHEPSSSNGKD